MQPWVLGSLSSQVELTVSLEMVQLVGQHCPPRSMNGTHEEAFSLPSLPSDGVQRVSPREQPGPQQFLGDDSAIRPMATRSGAQFHLLFPFEGKGQEPETL